MAFPTTVTNWRRIALHNPCSKPELYNSAIYLVLQSASDASILGVVKSSTPDTAASFAEVDSGNHIDLTNSLAGAAHYRVGNVLHIAHQEQTTGRVGYSTFDLSTETWGTKNEAVTTPGVLPPTSPAMMGVDICVRSDGDVIILYESGETVSAAARARVQYARKESGSWTVDIAVSETGVTTNYTLGRIILGASDRMHFFWRQNSDSFVRHRSLNSSNTLASIATASGTTTSSSRHHSMGYGCTFMDGSDLKIFLPFARGTPLGCGIIFTDADTPTFSQEVDYTTNNVTDSNENLFMGAVYDTADAVLYMVWSGPGNDGFFSTRDAGVWAAEVEVWDAITFAYPVANIYTRGGSRVLGVCYDNNSSVASYREYTLPAVSSTSVPVIMHHLRQQGIA